MFIKRMMAVAIIAMAALIGFGSTALAQSKILVVDTAKVYSDSTAVQGIAAERKNLKTTMESELRASKSVIDSETQSLNASLQGMTEAQYTARPDLQQRNIALEKKKAEHNIETKFKQLDLEKTENLALAEVDRIYASILESLRTERGADIIIDRTQVLVSSPTVDVTATVSSRLNSQLPSVAVSRQYLERPTVSVVPADQAGAQPQ